MSVPTPSGRRNLCGNRTDSVAEALTDAGTAALVVTYSEPSAYELAALALEERRISQGEHNERG